uniref:Uncharacterized LOC106949175 n=1 Tax=Poecilia latipinna TaxID=48699 RepID=A0A3B3U352_9TELE
MNLFYSWHEFVLFQMIKNKKEASADASISRSVTGVFRYFSFLVFTCWFPLLIWMFETRCCPYMKLHVFVWQVFKDSVHGSLELHPVLVKIIDTPQFQRLRNIKQLGGTYYVYPGASHNRFEHSIGVAHLAGELLQTLKKKQQKLRIDERDVLCVQIAGLCHDLGHGPFSHMFDQMFIPKARPGYDWSHEKASQDMFDHLVEENELNKFMEDHGLVPKEDLPFIKELIDPPNVKTIEWPHHGRPREKAFLYEVVSNKRNKIDVDKWDYFARDFHHLGMKNNFDCHRLIKFARVCEVDEEMQICYRDKEGFNLYNMFYTRFCLHKRACQHKVANSIEWMITDAFLKADKHIKIEGKDGKMFTLSTAIDDMVAYTKLTVKKILNHLSADRDIKKGKEILDRVLKRDLYRCWGEFHSNKSSKEIKVSEIKLDYGKQDKDPIEDVRFYQKDDPDKAEELKRDDVSNLLPAKFEETIIRFYCKRTNDPEAGKQQFKKFKSTHDKFPALMKLPYNKLLKY